MTKRSALLFNSLLFASLLFAPHLALGETPHSSADSTASVASPKKMIRIPPGEFTMGTDVLNSMPNERPAHRVRLTGFWIDEHPVTNAEFQKFVEATNYLTLAEKPVDWEELKKQVSPGTPKPNAEKLLPGALVYTPPAHPVDLRDMSQWWSWTTGANWSHPQGPTSDLAGKAQYPVVQVAWFDADAYCRWAGKRLPTEAEWEYAARGGLEGKRYSWGDGSLHEKKFMANTFTGDFPQRNTAEDGFERSSPVKSFPPNGYGLYDMGGNVWQWTADIYRPDAHAKTAAENGTSQTGCAINPKGPSASFNPLNAVPEALERVTKGGSFLCNPKYCESYRPSARRGITPDTALEHTGFRCTKE